MQKYKTCLLYLCMIHVCCRPLSFHLAFAVTAASLSIESSITYTGVYVMDNQVCLIYLHDHSTENT